MKIYFISAIIGPLLFQISFAAEFQVGATLFRMDSDPGSAITPEPALIIKILESDGTIREACIDKERSGAMNATNWKLEWTGNGGSETFEFPAITPAPKNGGHATQIHVKLAEELGKADPTKASWHLTITGTASKPALVIRNADGSTERMESVDMDVDPIAKSEPEGDFKPVEPNITFGGGVDGAAFSIAFAYNTGVQLTDDVQLYGAHAEFEGSFTPDPGEAELIYGRFAGEAGMFRTWGLPVNDLVSGSLFFDGNTLFASDQEVNNYNWTFGAGVWGFLGFKPLTLFSRGLYAMLNPGDKEGMTEPPILTTYFGYDRIVKSDQDAGTPDQGMDRFRYLARYRTPFWRKVDLPFLPTTFDVDGVVDFSGVWDLEEGSVRPEVKTSIEFMPANFREQNLAFSLSYVAGKISPTYVDEEAFLAGIRLRF